MYEFFFFQAEDGIRDDLVTGVQTCALPISGWMKENPATDVDRNALDAVRKAGMVPVDVTIPDWPYDSLDLILFAEAAAALDRKSTRLNSSHQIISYAVFCLKKKKRCPIRHN